MCKGARLVQQKSTTPDGHLVKGPTKFETNIHTTIFKAHNLTEIQSQELHHIADGLTKAMEQYQ